MSILIENVRVFGFRGLNNFDISLGPLTVLTGMNNTGKTSFLKAIQLALGNNRFISHDDFFVSDKYTAEKIIIDIKIVPIDVDGNLLEKFSDNWEILFGTGRIIQNFEGKSFVPFRTIVYFDPILNNIQVKHYILKEWPDFIDENGIHWYDIKSGRERNFRFDEVPFFYEDAQRDVIEDIKYKNSYLGRIISKIDYSEDDISYIEDQINQLNEETISRSQILSILQKTLGELDSTMGGSGEGVNITPFTKKVRDLNKGLSIYYTDKKESFSMEYHGMGTRSWSSLLTLKSFIVLLDEASKRERKPFFPILAIEEPEAHLHPNAQKKLFNQISKIPGQKIISTHSSYIASSAELGQIRNFYCDDCNVTCGKVGFDILKDSEAVRKIKRQVVKSRGEILFSKVIVFFEGETEEQALPIFAKHYFAQEPSEIGIDFVGVGGYGSYLPFLKFAENMMIPWFIISDAESNVISSVSKQFTELNSSKKIGEMVVFLDAGFNFEKQLLKDGYIKEIKNAIKKAEIQEWMTEQQIIDKVNEIDKMCNDQVLKYLKKQKTQMGPLVAEEIISSGKELPPKVIDVFNKVYTTLNGAI